MSNRVLPKAPSYTTGITGEVSITPFRLNHLAQTANGLAVLSEVITGTVHEMIETGQDRTATQLEGLAEAQMALARQLCDDIFDLIELAEKLQERGRQ
ncbi:hypothetical protein [Hydrogenophilus thermoluteolus]|uniref:Uncharacterized protein n=1 Tax=Hydrogenophilus thermoluteolus TaxID=297 RepID=A0A2Z6DY37_HYDTE|nr:hypothetical protein [Hydrogenophilus thermoluteolus]BBD77411.1 hypothetical protein HPTL_1147 [Hydrogenophilus thermoluteolus]